MYESHFGFSGSPFQLNPDPSFYFESRGHGHALSYLKFGAHQGEGFIVVTGEIGAGKTTLVRTLLGALDSELVVAAQIVSTQLESGDLLRAILTAFGVRVTHDSKAHLISTLEAFLTALAAQGKRALLIVDEAQNLRREAVEELRMLSNFQLGNHALLQSFLVGQPELRTLLKSKAMEQLRQRVTASCHLEPLDSDETRQYIEHRLRHVGWTGNPHFSDEAHAQIVQWTGGVPRRINRLCNRLLLAAYLSDSREISADVVGDVAGELRAEIGEAVEAPSLSLAPSPVIPLPSNRTAETSGAATSVGLPPLVRSTSARSGAMVGIFENRTDFFKFAALAQAFAQTPGMPPIILLHTGSADGFVAGDASDRMLPVPVECLHLEATSRDYVQVARVVNIRLDALISEVSPSAVLSIGSGDAMLACNVLAKKRGSTLVRIDAGERRSDAFPRDELNASLCDRMADRLFTDRRSNSQILQGEGIAAERIQCVGNLVADFFQLAAPYLLKRGDALAGAGLSENFVQSEFALVSARPGFERDSTLSSEDLLATLRALGVELPLVWPLQPAELQVLVHGDRVRELASMGVHVIADGGYIATLNLLQHAAGLVASPEGALLQEAFYIGKPSMVVGAGGTKFVAGISSVDAAIREFRQFASDTAKAPEVFGEWDGQAAFRIADQLRNAMVGLTVPKQFAYRW